MTLRQEGTDPANLPVYPLSLFFPRLLVFCTDWSPVLLAATQLHSLIPQAMLMPLRPDTV